jgi:DNA-binding beta-propeller fold protein YncE
MSREGAFLTSWGSGEPSEGNFGAASGATVDSNGNVYVSDYSYHRIQKFDGDGNFIIMWGWGVDTGASAFEFCTSGCQMGIAGAGNGQLDAPAHLAVDAADNIYVADANNNRVQVFNKNGTYLRQWGGPGTAEGQLGTPIGIGVGPDGRVYVSDRENHRVQKFSATGTFIRMWGWGVRTGADAFQRCATACLPGAPTNGDGGFTWPLGIAFDAWGRVYVVDQVNGRVQVFDEAGAFLMNWGSGGSGDGYFLQPAAVAIGPFQDIYVSDTVNHNLQRFRAHPLWYFEGAPEPAPTDGF